MELGEEILKVPYYEAEYIDDYNKKHLAFVKSKDEINTLKERFTLLEYNLITKEGA